MTSPTPSRYASELDSGVFAEISSLARRVGIHILGSTLSLRGTKHCNTLTVFAPDGSLLADYSKIYLFRLMDEHKYLCAGEKPGRSTCLLEGQGWRSVTICASRKRSVPMRWRVQ